MFPHNKLYKEILLHQQLRHPNIASLLGFCLRGEEVEGVDLETHGVVAVYEIGETVLSSTLLALPGKCMRIGNGSDANKSLYSPLSRCCL